MRSRSPRPRQPAPRGCGLGLAENKTLKTIEVDISSSEEDEQAPVCSTLVEDTAARPTDFASNKSRSRSNSSSSGACSPVRGTAISRDVRRLRVPPPPRFRQHPRNSLPSPPPPPPPSALQSEVKLPIPQQTSSELTAASLGEIQLAPEVAAPDADALVRGTSITYADSDIHPCITDVEDANQKTPSGPPCLPHAKPNALKRLNTSKDPLINPVKEICDGLIPRDQRVCFHFLRDSCWHGKYCWLYHPPTWAKDELVKRFSQIPCKFGASCFSQGCMFQHPEPSSDMSCKLEYKRERSPDSQASCISESGEVHKKSSGSMCTSGSESSSSESSDSSRGTNTCTTSLQPAPRQFLQRKEEPHVLHRDDRILMVAKPAGWLAHGTKVKSRSSVAEDLLSSGSVEPLCCWPSLHIQKWRPLLMPGEAVSGWVLAGRNRSARRQLVEALWSAHLTSYSIALVPGKPAPESAIAIAQCSTGILHISVLAVVQREAAEEQAGAEWAGHTAGDSAEHQEYYTLLLLKASGSACGGERALIVSAWGTPVHGDTDHGSCSSEQWHGCRPFFHCYACAICWDHTGEAGLFVTCPLTADLRTALTNLRGLTGDAAMLLRELQLTGQIGKELLTTPANYGVFDPNVTLVPDIAPFGEHRWGDSVSRKPWIVRFVLTAASQPLYYGLRLKADGWVGISELLDRFPVLAEGCFNGPDRLVTILNRDPSKALLVNSDGTCVKPRDAVDRLQALVETYASQLPPDARLPVAELMENSFVKELFEGQDMAYTPLLNYLSDGPYFDVDRNATSITLRPLHERVRLVCESLLENPNRELSKRIELGKGTVPLYWLLSRYPVMLTGQKDPPPAETLVSAFEGSCKIEVDRRTLAVRQLFKSQRAQPDALQVSLPCAKARTKAYFATARDMKTFCNLLEFYFEPFSLQHNRFLLYSVLDGLADDEWCWMLDTVAVELKRLGNVISNLCRKGRLVFFKDICSKELEFVKLETHICDDNLVIRLKYVPDIRRPISSPCAPMWAQQHFFTSDESREPLPPTASVVLSYALARCKDNPLNVPNQKQTKGWWERLVLRQIAAYRPDILCLQQFEAFLDVPECTYRVRHVPFYGSSALQYEEHHTSAIRKSPTMQAIIARLEAEDYEWCAAPSKDTRQGSCDSLQANLVLWRRDKWQVVNWGAGEDGSLHVALSPQTGVKYDLHIGCLEARGVEDLQRCAGNLLSPAILCGTFGMEPQEVWSALNSQGLSGFRSAHSEVMGRDLEWTSLSSKTPASPDGIWLRGGTQIVPHTVLDGHQRSPQDVLQGHMAFPAEHLPLVAALDCLPPGGVEVHSLFEAHGGA